MPMNGFGSASRCVELYERDTVTELPKAQGGAGLNVAVRYDPLFALMLGAATESI